MFNTKSIFKRFWSWFSDRGFKHLIMFAVLAFVLYPIIWIISASVNPVGSLSAQSLVPDNPTLENYRLFFLGGANKYDAPFLLWLWNSLKLSVLTGLIGTAMSALAAYAFSRFRFTGRRTGLLSLLLVQLFPQMLAMVALYFLLLQIGDLAPWLGLNTHTGLLMVYLGGSLGFHTWLLKGFFDSIPHSLEESAQVDGASHFQAFIRIILPLARPMLAVIFILTMIFVYSDFILASILLQDSSQYTLAVGLKLFIFGSYNQRWGIFAAAALIGALPIVAIFLSLQDQIVAGLTQGSVKG
ncbi:maltose ABC transporter permease MalG [Candidatus Bipolaricaulota bacterium]|nr:maltose ABC transporter permease MalG [Candidatus Bipolaricaulota bacterium]